jgi:hypothetical protein
MNSKKVLINALVISSILYIISSIVKESDRQFQKRMEELNSSIHDISHVYLKKCDDISYHLKCKCK